MRQGVRACGRTARRVPRRGARQNIVACARTGVRLTGAGHGSKKPANCVTRTHRPRCSLPIVRWWATQSSRRSRPAPQVYLELMPQSRRASTAPSRQPAVAQPGAPERGTTSSTTSVPTLRKALIHSCFFLPKCAPSAVPPSPRPPPSHPASRAASTARPHAGTTASCTQAQPGRAVLGRGQEVRAAALQLHHRRAA